MTLTGRGLKQARTQELWAEAEEAYPDVQFLFYCGQSVSSTCLDWRASDRNVAIRQAFTNWENVENFKAWDDVTYVSGADIIPAYPVYEYE